MWEAQDLANYWAENPPAHIILAAVHMKRDEHKKKPQNVDELLSLVGMAGGNITRSKKEKGNL